MKTIEQQYHDLQNVYNQSKQEALVLQTQNEEQLQKIQNQIQEHEQYRAQVIDSVFSVC